MFQSHVLRLRAVICNAFYPRQTKARAVWLYNQILATRTATFTSLKLFSSQKQTGEMPSKFQQYMAKYPLLGKIAGLLGFKYKHCYVCALKGKEKDMDTFKHCVQCSAPYCLECHVGLVKGRCTRCRQLVTFDTFKVDEEVDSSGDEDFTKEKIQKAVEEVQERGRTQAEYIEELRLNITRQQIAKKKALDDRRRTARRASTAASGVRKISEAQGDKLTRRRSSIKSRRLSLGDSVANQRTDLQDDGIAARKSSIIRQRKTSRADLDIEERRQLPDETNTRRRSSILLEMVRTLKEAAMDVQP